MAAGERLSFRQGDIRFQGHAIECRVNAECPDTFVPSPGTITAFSLPGGPGVRVDTAMHAEATVTPYYDSLIAKVMAYGRDRDEAIARMRAPLEMTVVEGIKTSIPMHLRILADPDFRAGPHQHGLHGALPAAGQAREARRVGVAPGDVFAAASSDPPSPEPRARSARVPARIMPRPLPTAHRRARQAVCSVHVRRPITWQVCSSRRTWRSSSPTPTIRWPAKPCTAPTPADSSSAR